MKNTVRKTEYPEQILQHQKKGTVLKLSDFLKESGGTNEPGNQKNTLKGLPVSQGLTDGTALVIKDPSDFSHVKADHILVCKYPAPELTGYFPFIKGIVTDMGGLLNPTGTAAREFHLPAVFGTKCSTDIIHSGDKIKLDGNRGTIKIIN